MEEWRDVVFYEGLYQISDAGRAWSVRGRHLMHLSVVKGGYLSVELSMDGIRHHYPVHMLVAEAFIGPCPPHHERNHKNGQTADNRVENLE